MAHRSEISENARWINPMPLFHCGGCVVVNLGCIAAGACHIPLVRFDAARVVLAAAEERATVITGVPTMLIAVEEEITRSGADLAALTHVVSGGSVVPRSLPPIGVSVTESALSTPTGRPSTVRSPA